MRTFTTALAFALAAPLFAAELGTQNNLVAHEWGTFTSVAGADGDPVRWSTLSGPADLPCFVAHGPELKSAFEGLVRMETPVLYFYSKLPMKLSVDVNFLTGTITEWYPRANDSGGSRLHWDSVELTPGQNPQFPMSHGASRYFAARNTDAAPLDIGGEREKMIFYRGVGSFAIPLRPKFTADGKVEVRNISQDRIPLAILFENRGGKLGYRIEPDFQESATLDPPESNGNIDGIRSAIYNALVERGLYPKEAQAMLDTWQDSWFEEGMRLIYVLPQRPVDAVLPLSIQPAPAELTRAFVGRIELLSPSTKQDLLTAASAGAVDGLKKYGRFLSAFAGQIKGLSSSAAYRQAAEVADDPKFGRCIQ